MLNRTVAIACLVAGVALLTGPGWALLVAGLLVEFAWPRDLPARLATVRTRLRVAVGDARARGKPKLGI